jgi:hypothetical protein
VTAPGFVAWIARRGLRKGILERSRPWLYTGLAAVALRVARRIAREQPRTVLAEELEPGQRVEIRVLKPER